MLELWKQLIKMNVKRWMEYRVDFFVGIIAMFLTNVISVVFFWVIFSYIPALNGWSFNQLLFLLGLSYFSFGIWHAFLSGSSPHRIERFIANGEFDSILLRPLNPMLNLTLSNIDDDGFGDLIAGILLLIYSSSALSIVWSLTNLIFMALSVFGAVLTILSINILFSTATFWVVRSRMLSEILWPLMKFIDYPLDIYNPIIVFILTFIIPLGFINYYPAQLFLGKGVWMLAAYLTPLVGVTMFIISYSLWKYGIKNYTSTGT
jgi:ABC-2 type transport system permease protein